MAAIRPAGRVLRLLTLAPPPCAADPDAALRAKVEVTAATLPDLLAGLDAARAAVADAIVMGCGQCGPAGSFSFFVEGL